MRFITIAVAALFASVASASILARQGPPACTSACLTNTPTGTCGTDNACLCRDNAFIAAQAACFAKDCSGTDLDNANAFARQLCEFEGVTLTAVPTVTSSSGGSASTSSVSSIATSTKSTSVAPSSTAPSSTNSAATTTQTGNAASTLVSGKGMAMIAAVVAGAFAL
ncbi:hypothetical protein M422DRAFT_71434 [Sphaerobolus stellatus SS14]|uniref:CFEM domain-containing protein n=1 Tax=Sphaerobolus stellatus (strain SS14) TaxID=990650 RepID=A0A0C9USS4_SPHS4|nr:hypothetical protein M422DRAFT_71434 [Sphaerobolus stellatus SS14]